MTLQTFLVLLAAICFFIEAVVWPRISDRVYGLNLGWLGLFFLTLGVWLIK